MKAIILARALESDFREKALIAGLEEIRQRYYEEYTDAECMDNRFYSSFQDIFDLCFPSGETDDGREFESFATKPGN